MTEADLRIHSQLEGFECSIGDAIDLAAKEEAAEGSVATTASRLRTWDSAAAKSIASGTCPPPLAHGQLSPELVKGTIAFFIKNKYRTGIQYLSDTVQRHKRHHDISDPPPNAD